ncbi:hypothetical protein GGI1_12193 [Acidithiobacillus sp. GGI-221]|nr:hypothetical protein GGI1_12193 [Acidithiobacillus sp. GGI-221]
MKINELWNAIINLHRQQPLISLMVWVNALIAGSVLPLVFNEVVWILPYVFVIGSSSFVVLASNLQTLVTRIRAGDGGPEWDVMINGVTSGQISDAAYASIRRDVLLDYRVYLAQLWNCVQVSLRVVAGFLVVIPAFLFWAVVACVVFAPGDFTRIVLLLQKITPGMVAANASGFHGMIVALFIVYLGALLVVVRRFGFVNRFDEAVNNGVRRAVACTATGDVFLVRFDTPWECRALVGMRKIKRKTGEFVHP